MSVIQYSNDSIQVTLPVFSRDNIPLELPDDPGEHQAQSTVDTMASLLLKKRYNCTGHRRYTQFIWSLDLFLLSYELSRVFIAAAVN